MKLIKVAGVLVVLAGVLFAAFAQDGSSSHITDERVDADDYKQRYVQVTAGLANIYERLDPTSPSILPQAKRGDYLDLLGAGELWFKVRHPGGREGFMETKDGKIVDQKGGTPYGRMILIVVVLMLGCVACVLLFVKKSQQHSAA